MYWINVNLFPPRTAKKHPLNQTMLKIITKKLLNSVRKYDLKMEDVLFDTIVPPKAANNSKSTIVTMYLETISQYSFKKPLTSFQMRMI